MQEIDVHQLAALRQDGAEIIDVREPGEYVAGHVPGARLIPMSQLAARLHEVQRGRPVYLICASGNRSKSMAAFMLAQGYQAVNVAGGTNAWVGSGKPLASGPRP